MGHGNEKQLLSVNKGIIFKENDTGLMESQMSGLIGTIGAALSFEH